MTNNEKKFCICHKLQVATYISREIKGRPKSRCPNVPEKTFGKCGRDYFFFLNLNGARLIKGYAQLKSSWLIQVFSIPGSEENVENDEAGKEI